MPVTHDVQLGDLQRQLTSLQSDLNSLAKRSEIQRIIDLIKVKKGWTTPAEFSFAVTITKSLQSQFQQVNELLGSFEHAAQQVEVQAPVHA